MKKNLSTMPLHVRVLVLVVGQDGILRADWKSAPGVSTFLTRLSELAPEGLSP
jgi:hypothetical protein